jgi:DNA primase
MSEPVYDISDDVKRDVLAATDLVSLVGATTSLKKAGRSWKGLCPFHGEKTPSFHVHPDKGFYYCFGCGAKGDAITFVRETERLEFPEAVAYLARLAGVTLPMRRSGTRVDRGKETRAAEALVLAAGFFRTNLDRHAAARTLLEKRGLPLEEAHAYGFGAALDAWDALKTSLSARVPEDTLLDAGLLQRNPETGRVYDRFRNRLTIEIRDGRGEILGFGARAFGDDQPKYLNSPETARFSKGKLLYGLDRAKEAIRKEDTVLLVEGYFDRIACERAGAANAVASMGTALTPAQADLLARQAATVIVAYDGDAPGMAAAYKAFPLLLTRGTNVRHLALPDGHDPDSYLQTRGADALRGAIAAAPALLETLLARIPASGGPDPTERAAKLREAVDILSTGADPVLRHELLAGLSKGAGVPLSVLAPAQGKKTSGSPVKPTLEAAAPRHSLELPKAEARVLRVFLNNWTDAAPLVRRIPEDLFTHPISIEIFRLLSANAENPASLDFSELSTHLGEDAGAVALQFLLSESSENRLPAMSERGGMGLADARISLLLLQIRRKETILDSLQAKTRKAVEDGDSERIRTAMEEKRVLSQELARLWAEFRRKDEKEA